MSYIHILCIVYNLYFKIYTLDSNCDKKVEKGAWWMPRLTQAMKDVISCDKLR